MANVTLYQFIDEDREELIRHCRENVAKRSAPPPTDAEIDHGVPLFLESTLRPTHMAWKSQALARRRVTMRFSSVFVIGLMYASSAFAQAPTPSVRGTANPELVGILANALGGTPKQAEGAAGSLFSAAKGRMKVLLNCPNVGTCSA